MGGSENLSSENRPSENCPSENRSSEIPGQVSHNRRRRISDPRRTRTMACSRPLPPMLPLFRPRKSGSYPAWSVEEELEAEVLDLKEGLRSAEAKLERETKERARLQAELRAATEATEAAERRAKEAEHRAAAAEEAVVEWKRSARKAASEMVTHLHATAAEQRATAAAAEQRAKDAEQRAAAAAAVVGKKRGGHATAPPAETKRPRV